MTSLLALKLFLAPIFVGLVSVIQRRWGDQVGGRLIGLPLTTGPFIFIIYIQEGRSFAAHAAHGVLVGQVALIIFAWSYATAATRTNWMSALATGTLACLASGTVLTAREIPLIPLLLILSITWACAKKYWPAYDRQPHSNEPPSWELPIRLVATVFIILILSGFASILGAGVAGALSTYPVIASVLGAFNQRRFGPTATVATLHGMIQTLPITTLIMSALTVFL